MFKNIKRWFFIKCKNGTFSYGVLNGRRAAWAHLNSPTFFFFSLEDGRSAGSEVTGRDWKEEDGYLFLVFFTFFYTF